MEHLLAPGIVLATEGLADRTEDLIILPKKSSPRQEREGWCENCLQCSRLTQTRVPCELASGLSGVQCEWARRGVGGLDWTTRAGNRGGG